MSEDPPAYRTGTARPALSLVVPVHDEAGNIAPFVARACAALDALALDWEIVFVDDGSRDASLPAMLAARERDRRIVVVVLTRNFGKEVALTAGLEVLPTFLRDGSEKAMQILHSRPTVAAAPEL